MFSVKETLFSYCRTMIINCNKIELYISYESLLKFISKRYVIFNFRPSKRISHACRKIMRQTGADMYAVNMSTHSRLMTRHVSVNASTLQQINFTCGSRADVCTISQFLRNNQGNHMVTGQNCRIKRFQNLWDRNTITPFGLCFKIIRQNYFKVFDKIRSSQIENYYKYFFTFTHFRLHIMIYRL